MFDFGSGDISESEYLSVSGGRWFQFERNHQIALFRISVGDRAGAREYLEKTDHVTTMAFVPDLVHTYLIRMKQDPNWPPWIPVKD
jgi:hypothetical protein